MNIYEDQAGYKVTATSFAVTYNIIEADGLDAGTVRAALLNFAPVTNSPPGATYAWPRRGLSLDEAGPGVWKATVTWSSLTYQYSLKIGGSSQQVRCDKTLTQIYVSPAAQAGTTPAYSAGDKGRPIGFDGRTVHGTSIYVPTRTWTEAVEIPISQYSFDYEDAIDAINEAPVNEKSFRGYDPGEVRFNGANIQLATQNPDFVTASFEFERTPNNSAVNNNLLTIDDIQGIAKDGWDFFDVHYAPYCPPGAAVMPAKADFVLIHRMYDRSDFAGLNIGTDENLPLWQG